MKNIFRKIILLVLAVLCVLGLSACSAGSTIETTLNINQDLSGKRVMDVAINADAFRDNFHGDINTLNQIVESSCPAELTWKYQNVDGIDSYHVELDFSSPADYKKKVESLLGKETTLELSAPTTIWANGFRIKEGFSSSDLLAWLGDILVEGQVVDSSNKSDIFSNGTTKVAFGGKTFDANSTISVNKLEYLPLDRIDILTSITDVNNYGRSVIFYIPKASMAVKKNEIESFLNGNVPEGAASEWGEYENGTTMEITEDGMDLAALNAYTQKVLASENNEVVTEDVENESGVFCFTTGWKENLDFNAYAGDESGRVQTGYYISTKDNMLITNYPGGNFYVTEDDAYSGYGIGMSGKVATADLEYVIEKGYLVQEVDVTTTVKGVNKFERESEFRFAEVPDAGEQEQILSRIQERAGDLAEVNGEMKDDAYTVTIVQKGTEKELVESSEAVFEDETSITYGEDKGLMSLKHRTAYAESFFFGDFIYGGTDDYKLNYTVKMGFLNSVDKADRKDLEVSGGKVKWTGDGSHVTLAFSGSKWNLPGIALWIIILVAAAVVVRGLIVTNALTELKELAEKNVKLAAKKGKTQEDTVPAGQEAEQAWKEAAAAAMPKEQTANKRFCPECGSPYTEGDAFCESCGHKLDE